MRRETFIRTAIVAFGLTWLGAAPAGAEPIQFLFTGGGVGTLDGAPYSNPAFRITLTGDTADLVHPFGDADVALLNLAATIDLGAPGIATFSDTFYILSDSFDGNTTIFLGPMADVFDSLYWAQGFETGATPYNLDAPVGPIVAPYNAGFFGFDSVETSLGVFNVTQAGQAVFQATLLSVVPEPGGLALLAIGVIPAMGFLRRRREQVRA
jgi:hypothetical protein